MIIQKSVYILPYKTTFNYEIESNTTIGDLLSFIQEQENILGSINTWICYSQQRNIFLNYQDEVGDIDQESFIVQCNKQIERPKFITAIIQPQNINFQFKVISTFLVSEVLYYLSQKIQIFENFENWVCHSTSENRILESYETLGESESDSLVITTNRITILKKIQLGQNIQFSIEVLPNTKISEILENAKVTQKIQGDHQLWRCFSFQLNQYLNLDSYINLINEELLLITAYPTQNGLFNTEKLFQTSLDLFNTNLTIHNYTKQLHQTQIQPQLIDEEKIQLNTEIQDGLQKRFILFYFKSNITIEEIALSILNYLSIQINTASLDLYINGHQYNNQKDRIQTLNQFKIKNNSQVIARVRWLDTKANIF
ncbi:unnamed protein product [Paramecium sonneborni]|uniref:Uncharacterized protein n=1 Tax=Paramecium sonneborni TaxID=65129 RepID=A0A8S1M7P3_9CILI|nr:unnamed protein product [Paramecium sonneborni]